MTINNLRKQKIPTIMMLGALLFTMFGSVERASAAVSAAPTGTDILTQNGGTVVTTFTPALGSTITASTTGATAYYGVRAVTSTSSPDVFWEITVSHATSTLTPGMVSITEKGWFDATGNAVADSPYIATVSGGDLVLTGNSGWGVALGDDFTNVDEIVFSGLAPLGTYTVTRVLMDTASSTPLDTPYVFNVDLVAAAVPDTTAPVFATTTDIFATTSATSTIVNYTNPTTTDDMDPSPSVVCNPASGSVFALGTTTVTCTAMDNASNTATTTFNVIVTLSTSTSTATTTPPTFTITHPIFASGLFCATSTPVLLQGTTAASSTITVVGGLSNSTTTSNGAGAWSTMINLASNSTSTVLVTITDSSSNVIGTTTLDFAFDNTDPTITLNGSANMSVNQGSTFTDPGVTVSDNLDANVATSTSGTVDVNTRGTYTITYTATDCAGNTASVTRTVVVEGGGGGGSGSSSGRPNTTNNTTGSVLGGTVEGTTTFVSPFNPFQQVLGASAFIPGIPNTGAGGNASTNLALLLASLGLVALGTQVLRKRSQQTQ